MIQNAPLRLLSASGTRLAMTGVGRRRTAAERNHVTEATRRRRRILQSRILCSYNMCSAHASSRGYAQFGLAFCRALHSTELALI